MEKIKVLYKKVKPFLESKFMRTFYGWLLFGFVIFTIAIILRTHQYYVESGFGWPMIKGIGLSCVFTFESVVAFLKLAEGYEGNWPQLPFFSLKKIVVLLY